MLRPELLPGRLRRLQQRLPLLQLFGQGRNLESVCFALLLQISELAACHSTVRGLLLLLLPGNRLWTSLNVDEA